MSVILFPPLKFISRVKEEFGKDKCLIRASSLSYSTLLAIVPLSGLIFALFTAFGAFDAVKVNVQNFIVQMLIPTMQTEILSYLNTFIVNSKALGIAGLLIFAFTSILLIDSISENFNAVWQSSNRRNFIAKFTSYSSVIVFGTLFIGTSFAITNPIQTFITRFPKVLFLTRWFMQLLPSVFIFITFLLMITAIPAGKVALKSAFLGALCGTILWDISRWFFVNGTNYALRMSVIYGSLAAIPIFLLWLYIIWIIILASVEITYVHQHQKKHIINLTGKRETPLTAIYQGMDLFVTIAENFMKGKTPFSVSGLAYVNALSVNRCIDYLNQFADGGLLYVSPDKRIILPLQDLDTIPAAELFRSLIGALYKEETSTSRLTNIMNKFFLEGYSSVGNITIRELLS